MKTKQLIATTLGLALLAGCGKKSNDDMVNVPGDVIAQTMTAGNGITYRSFTGKGVIQFKGILVMGSGNDENNPSAGSLNGGPETDLCVEAAQHGYVAAVVQYRKTPGTADWNTSAQQIAEDYDKCISALAEGFGVDKSKSVVGGESYSSYMLLTAAAYYTNLNYVKGVLAPCGSTDQYTAEHLKLPIYSIVCQGGAEGGLAGIDLYNALKDPALKAKSAGVTDNSCNTHCGGTWTDKLYAQTVKWLQ